MLGLTRQSKQINKGFSLLEVLVAFSILAISLGILLKIFSSGVSTAITAEEYIIATQIAESIMVKTGIVEPLVAGKSYGVIAEKFHWSVNVKNIPNPASNPEVENDVSLMNVSVIIWWGDDAVENSRSVELNTIKTSAT